MQNNNPIEIWTREQCEAYLKQYPKSLRSDAVRKRLEFFKPEIEKELKQRQENEEKSFWNSHHKYSYGVLEYMKKYPEGKFIKICDDAFWFSMNSEHHVKLYMKNFPNGRHIGECDNKIKWFKAKKQEEEAKKCKKKEESKPIITKEEAKNIYYGIRGFVDIFLR